MNFKELRKNLRKDYSGFQKIRIAIVSDWAIQMLAQAVRGYGYERGLDLEIYEATYDQMEPELLNPSSELYHFGPDYILLFPCAEKFHEKYQKLDLEGKRTAAEAEFQRIEGLCGSIAAHSSAKVILSNYCEISDGIYGNYAATYEASYLNNQRRLNRSIEGFAGQMDYIYLLDVLALQNAYGRRTMFDEKLYYLSKTVFSMDTLALLAEQIVGIVHVISGAVRKCIVCDLDNTLWGGIIGDDGMDGIAIGSKGMGQIYSDIQAWIKELSQRGIAVAICSKNNEDTAKEPFTDHREMVLRSEDISVFIANWEDKASNIRKIQQILNIGMDSLVFIDDNPFERNLVKDMIPEITVPELPEDPAKYLSTLEAMNLFETVKVSDADQKRTQQYREEASRNELKITASNIEDYLRSLDMKAIAKPFDSYSIPRVAQLSQRSNQFNMRTIRYTEHDVQAMIDDPETYATMTVDMKDKFGEYGIIALVILKKLNEETLFLDTLIMSCRVLKRSVEEYVFNKIAEMAKERGASTIIGEYLPTKKNSMVKDLLENYDFERTESGEDGDRWRMDVSQYEPKKTFVEDNDE